MGLEASIATRNLEATTEGAPADGRERPEAVDSPATGDGSGLPPEPVSFFEKRFIRKLQSGDQKAFRELVRKNQDRVYSLCLRMLGDSHEAEDIAQEVFLAVHKHLPRFRGDCRLTTWLYRVAKNHCLNRLKYRVRRETADDVEVEGLEGSDAPGGLMSVPERPDRALLGAEERNKVQIALGELSEEHRLLVVLRDIEGLSYEEVARIAGLPAGTVKSRLHRARAALADRLALEGMAPDGATKGEHS